MPKTPRLFARSYPAVVLVSGVITFASTWVGCGGDDEGTPGSNTTGADGGSTSSGGSSSGGSSSGGSSSGGSSSGGSSSGDPGDAGNPCGNGAIDPGETCDDGNNSANDGCSATCTVETGWACADAGATSCSPVCGNGQLQPREACDRGDGGAGCSATCSIPLGYQCQTDAGPSTCAPVCNDGIVSPGESCDEGALNDEPGHCSATCSGLKAPSCGDGRIQAGEGCDDGANNGTAGFCAAGCPMGSLAMPAETNPYSGDVRGYWFTATKDFVLTSLHVPTTASTGLQSVAVLRLPAAPPTYNATTNTFDTLFLAQDSATAGPIAVRIPISKDEIIVVLGSRAGVNSYADVAPYATTIEGEAVTLHRAGMQFPLATTAPRDIWTEADPSISRVELGTARSQCGDGSKGDSEGCDDGNLVNGDGCSATCTVETGYGCTHSTLDLGPSVCTAMCGDMIVATNEGCDDGVDNGTAGKCATGCYGFPLDVGAHSASSPAGATRGFWFTAPTSFVIRGIRVPVDATDAGAASDQSFEIVKLLEAPPANGAATNAFQTLAYVRAVAGDTITKVKISVASGDRIGILGGRGTAAAITSSLSAGAVNSMVKTQALPLLPLAFDGSLDTNTAGNLRAATTAGPIGRVEVFWAP